jgi:SPP1 family predicted phage head-tail adaptor
MPAIGTYRHVVTLEEPTGPIDDGGGGWTEGYGPLTPSTWHCSIAPATARDLENIGAGTVLAQATHVVKGRYHAGITTKTRLLFKGRTLNVVFVANVDERSIETDLVCAEMIE